VNASLCANDNGYFTAALAGSLDDAVGNCDNDSLNRTSFCDVHLCLSEILGPEEWFGSLTLSPRNTEFSVFNEKTHLRQTRNFSGIRVLGGIR